MSDVDAETIAHALDAARPALPGAEVGRAVVESVTHELRPARGPSPAIRVAASVAVASAAVACFVLLVAEERPEGSASSRLVWGAVFVLLVAIGVGARPGRGLALAPRRALLLGVPALFTGALLASSDGALPLGSVLGGDASRAALAHCALVATALGAVVLGAVMTLWSRTDPFRPGLTGALVGVGGGLVGAASTDAVCPVREAWHLGLGHATIVILLGLVGWGVGRHALRP